jgi:hypothetical protein
MVESRSRAMLSEARLSGLSQLRSWWRGAPPPEPSDTAEFLARLTPARDVGPDFVRLIALQHADGSWDLTRELARAIGHDLAELESALAGAAGHREEARKAWATALALTWIELHAPEAEGEWRLLAAKGRQWLDSVSARPAGVGSWTDLSARLLAARAG